MTLSLMLAEPALAAPGMNGVQAGGGVEAQKSWQEKEQGAEQKTETITKQGTEQKTRQDWHRKPLWQQVKMVAVWGWHKSEKGYTFLATHIEAGADKTWTGTKKLWNKIKQAKE